jgi:hypothetical protein
VRTLLAARTACPCPGTPRVCRKLLSCEATLWTFAAAGRPPHNNATEQALRHGGSWRKTSYETDGEAGAGTWSGC